jgi:hypothetical protein
MYLLGYRLKQSYAPIGDSLGARLDSVKKTTDPEVIFIAKEKNASDTACCPEVRVRGRCVVSSIPA